jgi:TetR/AcrR family transcriptional regulator, transcriptional repressor for nem operon
MAVVRRVGAATSKTRDAILDSVEHLMLDRGYAAVTYRAVAGEAGVTAGLVQYYFPTLDEMFVATIRRRTEQNLERLTRILERNPDGPLRVLWEYSRDEATAAMSTEFVALANHRKTIRNEIADATERVRKVQLDAVQHHWEQHGRRDPHLSSAALLFMLTGIPKMIRLEQGVGVSTAHAEVIAAFERYLEAVEPTPPLPTRGARKRSPRLLKR